MSSEDPVFSKFSTHERTYLRSLRKRQRGEITKLFERSKRSRPSGDVPFRMQVLRSTLPEHVKLGIFEDFKVEQSEKYLSWVRKAIRLPLGITHPSQTNGSLQSDIRRASKLLDETTTGHYAMKREVLKILCQPTQYGTAYALGLEGPPGCGKTHFVKNSLAPALQLPYVSIPLGGVSDASFLTGCPYSYEGSKEGRLAEALIEAKCCNPIIHFDEVDKIPKTERGGEIESVLMHLIDPSEPTVRDKYFHGIDIDFSKCTFVFGYNTPDKISPILLDRIKRISMTPPTINQREQIVRHTILPRVSKRVGTNVQLSEGAIKYVTSRVKGGEGMRNVEKYVEHVISTAHLCEVIGEGVEGVGLENGVELYDASGDITVAFSDAVLKQLHIVDSSSKPPPNMYT
jgi:ATP-dependent Lon protease